MKGEDQEFSILFEHSPIGMAKVSIDNRWLKVNNAFAKITGYSKKELLHMNSVEMTHPDDIAVSQSFTQKALEGKIENYEIEKKYLHRNGHYIWCLLSVSLIRNENNLPQYFISQILDITDRKEFENSLHDAQDRYSRLIDATCDGFWDRPDMSKDEEYWSPRCKALLGYKDDEIQGGASKFLEMIHPDDLQARNQAIKNHIEKNVPYDVEYRLKRKSGEYRWFNTKCKMFKDPKTGKMRKIGTITDINNEKASQAALDEKNQIFESIFKCSSIGMNIMSLDGKFLKINDKMSEILGYPEDEIVGRSFLEFLSDDYKAIGREKIKILTEGKQNEYNEERCYVRKNGEKVWAVVSVSLIRDDNGKPYRILGLVTDISKRKEAEKSLKVSEERLELAIKGSNIGVCDYDLINNNFYWSNSIFKMLGIKPTKLNKLKDIEQFYHPEDRIRRRKSLNNLINNNSRYDEELRMMHSSGEYIWARVKGLAIRDKNGKAIRVTGSVENITHKKKMAEHIAEQSQVFETIFKHSENGIMKIGKDGVVLDSNSKIRKMLGYTKEEMSKLNMLEITFKDDIEQSRKHFAAMVRGEEESAQFEKRYLHKNGHIVWGLLSAVTIKDQDGNVLYLIAQIQDINKRKIAEEALAQSEERFELAIKASNVGIFDYNYEKDTYYWSESIYTMIGLKIRTFSSVEEIGDYFHPEDTIDRAKTIQLLIDKDKPYDKEYRIRHSDGHYIWVRIKGIAVRDQSGKAIRITGSIENITSRKNMEMQISQQAEIFESIFKNSAIGMCLVSVSGDIMKVNKNFCKMLGYGEKAITKMRFKDFTHPEDAGGGIEHLKLMIEGKEDSFNIEKRYIHRKGHVVWGAKSTTIHRDEEGNPLYFICQIQDIDDRKKAQAALAMSEERYELAVSGSKIGIWDWDIKSGALYRSPLFLKMLGMSKGDFDRKMSSVSKYIHPDDRERRQNALDLSLKMRKHHDLDFRMLHKKGHYIWVHAKGKVITDELGNPVRMSGSVEDITKKKLLEQELEERTEQFESVFKHSSMGMGIISWDHRYIKVNKTLSKILGYSQKELTNLDFKSITHEEDLPGNLDGFNKMSEGLRDSYHCEKRYYRKDGECIWVYLTAAVVRDNKCKPLYFVIQVKDITSRKTAEFELAKANERYQMLLSASKEAMWSKDDMDVDEEYWSPSYWALLGYEEDEIKSSHSNFIKTVHPDYIKTIYDIVNDCTKDKIAFDIDILQTVKSGEYRWFKHKGIIIKDPHTGKRGITGTVKDIHDQKIAEQKLKELRNRFDLSVDGSGAGLWFWDFETSSLTKTQRVHEMLGTTEETFPSVFSAFEERLHPDDLDYFNQEIRAHIEDGKEYNVDYRLRHDKGHYLWIKSTGKAIKDDAGRPYQMAGAVENITEKKQAEYDLAKANQRYELVIEASRDGIWEWPDISKDEQYWSQACIESLGYKIDEIQASASLFYSILHPEDVDKTHIQSDPKRINKATEVTFRIKTKYGKYRYFRAISILKQDKNSGVYSITGTVADIHDKQLAEKALKESKERYDLAIKGSRDGIWDWRFTDKEEVYWSPQMFNLIGYLNQEFKPSIDFFINELLHVDDKKKVEKFIEQDMFRNEIFDLEFRVKNKSGNYRWYIARGVVHTQTDEIWRISGSLTDVNDRKESEEKVIEYTKELERINEDLDNFAYIASHDLKEPVRGLNNNAIFLKEDFADKMGEGALKRIDRIMFLCARMEKLVDDLLHFARLKNQELKIKRVDVNDVIKDIEETIETVLHESNAEIVIKKKLPKVVCDKVIVTELFRNLITNGIKYNKSENKVIEIGCYKEDLGEEVKVSRFVFFVRDNGIGIEEKYHKDIFKVFKRLNDDDEFVRGTGVGLTFVKKIVERLEGEIWIESQPGKGSTFYFTLTSLKI